jgi:hypothetical protein
MNPRLASGERRTMQKQLELLVLAALLLATESLSAVGCSSASNKTTAPTSGWLKIEAGAFSINAPPRWEFHQRQGIDSFVGEFAGDGVVLRFDFGRYSNPLDEAHEPTYMVEHESIGGHRAKIVSPRVPGRGTTGIYFPEITDGNKLCLYGQNLTEAQQELALKIFETIRFGGVVPRYVLPPPPTQKRTVTR